MVALCQVAPSISANSDLPRLHSADRDGLMREKQRWKGEGIVRGQCKQSVHKALETEKPCRQAAGPSLGSSQGRQLRAVGAMMPLIPSPSRTRSLEHRAAWHSLGAG